MDNKRMEFLFLEHTHRWLVDNGVPLMMIPQARLDSSAVGRKLCDYCTLLIAQCRRNQTASLSVISMTWED
jgi:hypothetical protein